MRQNRKRLLAIILLFAASVIIRGVLGDFPKALRVYPDELRYVSIAESLFKGQGLQIHNMNSDFQKILYSICIMPAFLAKSSAVQIRLIGYLNSFIVSSSVFPTYALCRKMRLEIREKSTILVFWATLPTLLVSMYFMSEVIYLPLSLWVIYCAWCIFDSKSFPERIRLNILFGIMCYLAYLCKEIALYFILAYLVVCMGRVLSRQIEWKQESLCIILFLGTFVCCFLGMKMTLFYGLSNSYSSFNLSGIKSLELFHHPEKIRYLFYAFVYDTLFAVLALGVFPILVPLSFFDKEKKESWFYLFLLTAFLIGCAVIAYTITLPEEMGIRSPRQHLRYLEPFAIPFYIMMINGIGRYKIRSKVLITGVIICAIVLIVIGSGGGSCLVDNNMLVYYEFFVRFISKSNTLLLVVRVLMAVVLGIGILLIFKNKKDLCVFLALYLLVLIL